MRHINQEVGVGSNEPTTRAKTARNLIDYLLEFFSVLEIVQNFTADDEIVRPF